MEDIVAFVSDDENLTTVVAGVAVVGATIVGGLYASTRETAAQAADRGEKLEQVRQALKLHGLALTFLILICITLSLKTVKWIIWQLETVLFIRGSIFLQTLIQIL